MKPLTETTYELSKNVVHIWHCRFDTNRHRIDAFNQVLSEDERQKANIFKFEIHREQAIISRGVLRILLGRYLKKSPHELEFGYTEYDKPFLKDESNLQFNVSHSGNRAVFGFVQDVEIGIDIEKIKDDFEVMDIAQNFFSSDENKALKTLPPKERTAGFYRCWTQKESFIKAKGSGLSFPLTSFSVSLEVGRAELLHTDWDAAEKKQWQLFSFVPEEGYQGAISLRHPIGSLQQMDWDMESI